VVAGGGHAGLIARDHAVARAVYVSKGAGAVDADGDGQPEPAPWADDPRAMPPARQFGSTHEGETAWQYSPEVFRLWELGDYLNIHAFTNYPDDYAQYDCTHLVSTAAPVPATCHTTDPHPSMATDDCLALGSDGLPILAPAYYYFLAVEVP
jgi:hypothetical protein